MAIRDWSKRRGGQEVTEQQRRRKIEEFSLALQQLCEAYIEEGIVTYAEMLGLLELTKADILGRLYDNLQGRGDEDSG